jgi:membrane-associated phospholipid phosphatase
VSATTDDQPSWVRTTWPLDGRDWIRLVVALLLVVGVFSAVGWLFTDALAPNAITEYDDEVAQRLVDSRTEERNDLAHWGAMLADTPVKIGLTFIAAGVMMAVWRRWHEALFLAVSLIFEATAFITITYIVGRARPDVERLLDSPVDSSYPSGHVAAATVYGAFVVITFWHTRRSWIRAAAVAACTFVVFVVAWSRMYQGMHFLSDVVAGTALGLVSLAICVKVFGPPQPDESPAPPLEASTAEAAAAQ